MTVLVSIIVITILVFQIIFFRQNVHRMKEYKEIFEGERSWTIEYNQETEFVSGIDGRGNDIFNSIKDSINKYLGNNSGSVIDFQLLKDAVDRHCDSVENDINTLTPLPLYCGLAGTMAGVIVGLVSLLSNGSITALLSSGSGNFGAAANGVNDLLSGVAWAMFASICGIVLTTLSSIQFKKNKLYGESGKNTFLAWLQAKLLPELPSDTSDALNKLVKNLNKFNSSFAENTSELRGTLNNVNKSYQIQANIIKVVHDMDVMKMAKANVSVLQELKECTDKLMYFNQYLDDIHGYTDAIHKFTTLFEGESNRLHVLEEIQQYFMRHKAEIAKDSADVDVALKDALYSLKDSASTNVSELNKIFVQQAEDFKQIIIDEKESFEKMNGEIKAIFSTKISQIPMLESKLSEISEIPSKLDKLIDRIERSNGSLYTNVTNVMDKTVHDLVSGMSDGRNFTYPVNPVFPSWMKWSIMVSVLFIALASITNTVYNIGFDKATMQQVDSQKDWSHNVASDSIVVVNNKDSIAQKTTNVSNGQFDASANLTNNTNNVHSKDQSGKLKNQ